jgi:hypothetical protein
MGLERVVIRDYHRLVSGGTMKIRFLALAAFALLFASAPAYAYFYNDCSIASLSGSSTALFTKTNPQRKSLVIFNSSTVDNVGVNLAGGTAAIGGTGTITLVPLGSISYTDSDNMPFGLVSVIGTSGQPLVCLEGR